MVLGYRPSEETVELWATLLHNGGWYVCSQGRHNVVERMVLKARGSREKRLGSADESTLASTSLFVLILLGKSKFAEAENLFSQVIEIH